MQNIDDSENMKKIVKVFCYWMPLPNIRRKMRAFLITFFQK